MTTTSLFTRTLALTLTLAAVACDEPAAPAIAPDGAVHLDEIADDAAPSAAEVIAELDLDNGNTLTFKAFADGGVAVIEQGAVTTHALGMLPELDEVTPLELFRAVADPDMPTPPALVQNHEAMLAHRAAADSVGTMPPGFRVDEIAGFYDGPVERAFKDCTDTAAWKGSDDQNPIGANCPDPATTLFDECRTGWQPPLVDDCDGLACTETFAPSPIAGYIQMRGSVCMRQGVGDVRFFMGIKDKNQNAYAELLDSTLKLAGDYTYAWYANPNQSKHFNRVLYRTAPDRRVVNKSLWFRR